MTATAVHDTTVRLVDRRRYTTEDRAATLRDIAAHWDASLRSFEGRFSLDETVDGLLLAVAEYADPSLDRVSIRAYTESLVEACRALARFEVGDGWDGDEDDEKAYYSTDTVVGILNDDIDYALFPLVFGVDERNACWTCTRTRSGVHRWQTRIAGSAYCAEHGGGS